MKDSLFFASITLSTREGVMRGSRYVLNSRIKSTVGDTVGDTVDEAAPQLFGEIHKVCVTGKMHLDFPLLVRPEGFK